MTAFYILDPSSPSGLAHANGSGPAGCVANRYWCVHTRDNPNYADHVVWYLTHGRWPTADLQHVDGDLLNNDIANLKEVPFTHSVRGVNRRPNASGIFGVSWNPYGQRWIAQWRENGLQVMRTFSASKHGHDGAKAKAIEARQAALARLDDSATRRDIFYREDIYE